MHSNGRSLLLKQDPKNPAFLIKVQGWGVGLWISSLFLPRLCCRQGTKKSSPLGSSRIWAIPARDRAVPALQGEPGPEGLKSLRGKPKDGLKHRMLRVANSPSSAAGNSVEHWRPALVSKGLFHLPRRALWKNALQILNTRWVVNTSRVLLLSNVFKCSNTQCPERSTSRGEHAVPPSVPQDRACLPHHLTTQALQCPLIKATMI